MFENSVVFLIFSVKISVLFACSPEIRNYKFKILLKQLSNTSYAPSREFDYLIIKYDLISVIFRLHVLLTVFRNFLKNVKTLEPKTYITILIIP